jgi:hypothetical protein
MINTASKTTTADILKCMFVFPQINFEISKKYVEWSATDGWV